MRYTPQSHPSCITCGGTSDLRRCACAPYLDIWYCAANKECQKQGYAKHKSICKSARLYARIRTLELPRDAAYVREAECAVKMDCDGVAKEYLSKIPVYMRPSTMTGNSRIKQSIKDAVATLRKEHTFDTYQVWMQDNWQELRKKCEQTPMCDIPFNERPMMQLESGYEGMEMYVEDYEILSMGLFEVQFAEGRFCTLDPWVARDEEMVWQHMEKIENLERPPLEETKGGKMSKEASEEEEEAGGNISKEETERIQKTLAEMNFDGDFEVDVETTNSREESDGLDKHGLGKGVETGLKKMEEFRAKKKAKAKEGKITQENEKGAFVEASEHEGKTEVQKIGKGYGYSPEMEDEVVKQFLKDREAEMGVNTQHSEEDKKRFADRMAELLKIRNDFVKGTEMSGKFREGEVAGKSLVDGGERAENGEKAIL